MKNWLAAGVLTLAIAGCGEPPKFETMALGTGPVIRHSIGHTGLALRKRTCRFSLITPNLVLSYEGTEGHAAKEVFDKCLSLKNGDRLAAEKVVLLSGSFDGGKERFFARTDGGLKIQMH